MPDDFSKLIDLSALSRYNTNSNTRENTKLNSLYIRNKNDYIKRYFAFHADEKIYGVKFAYTAQDVVVPTGTKYGANTNLVVNPSTRTVVGRDDYRNINLFKSIDANVHYDTDGSIVIDYLEGEEGFSYYGKVDVVCLFAPVYERVYNETVDGTKYLCIEWTDTPRQGFTLNNLCKGIDGKNQGFYTITKFPSVWIDGAPYSSAGGYMWTNGTAYNGVAGPSYNNCVDRYHARNENMTAMTIGQLAMIQRIFMMKYASTNYQSKLNGLTSYYKNRLAIQTPTTNKSYLILTTTDANNLYVDTHIDVGNPTSDRQSYTQISVANNLYLSKKSNDIVLFKNVKTGFTISNTDYAITSETDFDILCTKLASTGDAVNLEEENISIAFAYTDPNTSEVSNVDVNLVLDVSGSTYTLYAYDGENNVIGYSASGEATYTVLYIDKPLTVNTTHSVQTSVHTTGYSLEILGKDGSYINGAFNTNQRNPSVLSGIELFLGTLEVLGNAVYSYDSNTMAHVLIQNDLRAVTKTTNDIAAQYTDTGYHSHTTSGTNWKYVRDVHYDLDKGSLLYDCDGASTTTGFCDGVYYLGDQKSGFYEVLLFGNLSFGGRAGPFCSYANNALSTAYWNFAARAAFVCSARAS